MVRLLKKFGADTASSMDMWKEDFWFLHPGLQPQGKRGKEGRKDNQAHLTVQEEVEELDEVAKPNAWLVLMVKSTPLEDEEKREELFYIKIQVKQSMNSYKNWILSLISATPTTPLICSFLILSFLVLAHIHPNIHISATDLMHMLSPNNPTFCPIFDLLAL